MNALVVYDSVYGNTEQISRAIGAAITGEVEVLRAGDMTNSKLNTIDLLIIGSPTQGGRATPVIQDFLKKIPEPTLQGVKVAAFDTRFSTKWVVVFGYAAGKIARALERKGGILVASPEGFFVEGTKGPLREGELERAADWVKEIVKRSD